MIPFLRLGILTSVFSHGPSHKTIAALNPSFLPSIHKTTLALVVKGFFELDQILGVSRAPFGVTQGFILGPVLFLL